MDFKDISEIPDSLNHNDFNLPDSYIYQDSVVIHRQIFNINVKFGYQFIRNRWLFDLYGGIGYRYRNVVYKNRTNPEDKELILATGGTAWGPLDDGAFSVPNFTIGVRVGYVFAMRKPEKSANLPIG